VHSVVNGVVSCVGAQTYAAAPAGAAFPGHAGQHGRAFAQKGPACLEGGPDRSHAHGRPAGGVKDQKESRAKAARLALAFYSPRPPLLRDFTKEISIFFLKPKPSAKHRGVGRGFVADAFFGASPVVASALGIRSGATPRGRIHSIIHPSALRRKEDISTWRKSGHFYLALTVCQTLVSSIRIPIEPETRSSEASCRRPAQPPTILSAAKSDS